MSSCLPVLRNAGVGSYAGRDADLHPVKQSSGRVRKGKPITQRFRMSWKALRQPEKRWEL